MELLSKAMYWLFEKKEASSEEKSKEIKIIRLPQGRKSEFVNLEDVTNTGSKKHKCALKELNSGKRTA